MPLEIVILAAGQGQRMRSSPPKILPPLAGRPLLSHVLDTARALAPRRIIVVHGNGAEQVRTAFADAQVEWALQAEQLGTGPAVQPALPSPSPGGHALTLCGRGAPPRGASRVPIFSSAAPACRWFGPTRSSACSMRDAMASPS